MSGASDPELLARVVERDAAASAEIFDRHASSLHRFLSRAAPRGEAEDLLQEVFVRALRRASSFRGESSVRTWLRGIARNVVLERYRSQGRDTSLVDVSAGTPGPESRAIAAQERLRLVAALELLPDDQAIVVGLHEIEGLPHGEIAELLEITAASSRKRLQRAMTRLREIFPDVSTEELRHSRLESWCASVVARFEQGDSACHRTPATR